MHLNGFKTHIQILLNSQRVKHHLDLHKRPTQAIKGHPCLHRGSEFMPIWGKVSSVVAMNSSPEFEWHSTRIPHGNMSLGMWTYIHHDMYNCIFLKGFCQRFLGYSWNMWFVGYQDKKWERDGSLGPIKALHLPPPPLRYQFVQQWSTSSHHIKIPPLMALHTFTLKGCILSVASPLLKAVRLTIPTLLILDNVPLILDNSPHLGQFPSSWTIPLILDNSPHLGQYPIS